MGVGVGWQGFALVPHPWTIKAINNRQQHCARLIEKGLTCSILAGITAKPVTSFLCKRINRLLVLTVNRLYRKQEVWLPPQYFSLGIFVH